MDDDMCEIWTWSDGDVNDEVVKCKHTTGPKSDMTLSSSSSPSPLYHHRETVSNVVSFVYF